MTGPAEIAQRLIRSRECLATGAQQPLRKYEAEGGCGVIGIACSEKIAGRHLLQSLKQMRNRGNGKGGGIAAAGLVAEELGVTQDILENNYLLSVAYLDPAARTEVERASIAPTLEIDSVFYVPHVDSTHSLESLEVLPPEVVLYFVRVKAEVVDEFLKNNALDASADSGLSLN
ncbi:MAG TPA: hypothetical protein VEI54_09215, partial [Candidatus Limnocylindrales bacterium]|nr:hypothetical protein [Candidatus Limnocylindrales bacterium]